MLSRIQFSIYLVCSILLTASPALACGGFFCTSVPIDQSAERIIFTINDDNTITAIVGINYVGAAEDFSWVVPVPSVPELDVADVSLINTLQQSTTRDFIEPRNFCHTLVYENMGGMGGGGGIFVEEGKVGPYDYAILGGNISGDIVKWLRENGYQVFESMEPIIAQYVDEGMYFVAMKLSQDSDVGDIQPVKMTYQAETPTIPIRLTAVAAVDNMPILTWIFADTQYVPENYAHATVDFSSFRSSSQILNPFSWFAPPSRYLDQLDSIQSEYNGLAFVTEYAQPSEMLKNESSQVNDEPDLVSLIDRFPYVTYLRAQMSPDQMTLDPSFVPSPAAENMPRSIDLDDYVDPLQYWGCGTRSISRAEPIELLPETARFDYWDVHVRYPEDWVISEFVIDVRDGVAATVTVFSPETVDEDLLRDFFEYEVDFPMFVMTDTAIHGEEDNYGYPAYYALMDILGMERPVGWSRQPTFEGLRWEYRTRVELYGPINSAEEVGVYFNLLTTEEDWNENEDIYNAMMLHVMRYQYFAHPELRHTVFVNHASAEDIYRITDLALGYPDGWIETITHDLVIEFMPIELQDDSNAPKTRFYNWTRLLPQDTDFECRAEYALSVIADLYSLSEEVVAMLPSTNADGEEVYSCTYVYAPISEAAIEFQQNDRRGYIRIIGEYLIESTAPIAVFEQYEVDLWNMVNSYLFAPRFRNAIG